MVQVQATASIPAGSDSVEQATKHASKVVVAVHGIGDQYLNATIQTVVSAFCRYADYPSTVPLGHFPSLSDGEDRIRAFQLTGPPEPKEPLGDIGFVEVYWADIPRKLQREGYVIEEAKAWARTVVERFRARYQQSAEHLDGATPFKGAAHLRLGCGDYVAGADAIEQMIETFAVLDNLLFIADRAGIVKFNLAELLTTYLGDVQIVADFQQHRQEILKKFRDVMERIDLRNNPEIYIIAHSEGTVVAFMGLLEAMSDPAKRPVSNGGRDNRHIEADSSERKMPDWAAHVRGFMTIGSPIDKHLVLWPEIWDPVQTPHPDLQTRAPQEKIEWRNYYDYGDPVGFRLDTAHQWLGDHGWHEVFNFDLDKHDHGFGRYLLPGAAHNDYWRDEAVFRHFIQDVIVTKKNASPVDPPENRPLRRFGSNVIPYLLMLGVVYLGSYLAYKGLHAFAGASADDIAHVTTNVSGITALLAGMIALARIPRLTRSASWLVKAVAIFAAGAAAYALLVQHEVAHWLSFRLADPTGAVRRAAGPEFLSPLKSFGVNGERAAELFTIICAALIAGLAAWGSRRDWRQCDRGPFATLRHYFDGAAPLVLPVAVYLILVIIGRSVGGIGAGGTGRLWPLLLAAAAFIYLWWLAILLFDLVFAWHRYIRHSVAHNYLYALRKSRKAAEQSQRAEPKDEQRPLPSATIS